MIMKLKVPVNSYLTTGKQTKSGADVIYKGFGDSHFNGMVYFATAQIILQGGYFNSKAYKFAWVR